MKILPIIQNILPKIGYKDGLPNHPCVDVSFTGNLTPLAEDIVDFVHQPMMGRDLKKLANKMVDLYTGGKMMTNEQLSKLKNSGVFNEPIHQMVKKLKPYAKDYLDGIELEVFGLIEKASMRDPDFTLPQLFNFWYISTRNNFRKIQKPYFDEIKELGARLPAEYFERFYKFMALTDRKLYDEAIYQKFSLKDFNYNVDKMLERITDSNLKNRVKHLMEMLNDKTMVNNNVPASSSIVKKAFNFVNKKVPIKKSAYYEKYMSHYELDKDAVRVKIIENIQDVASAKGYKRLENLCTTNLQMLKGKPALVPFSNKAFRYDLAKLLESAPDEDLKREIMAVANRLPTSEKSAQALILKYKYSDGNTIGDRLFNPSLASIEHIIPQSEGGSDFLSNCALARRKINYERKSEPLYKTLENFDAKNQQKYVDALIRLVNKGYLSSQDVIAQIQTIEKEGRIKLDYIGKIKNHPLTLKEEETIKIKQKYKDKNHK